jgi:hypothetical protein
MMDMIEVKKDINQHHIEKEHVKIVERWDIIKNNVQKDLEKLVQNLQQETLLQMILLGKSI